MPTPEVLSRGTLFSPKLVTDLIDRVKGKSSLARLCGQTPIPFNGTEQFIFSMDDEVDLVAENGAKSRGSIALTPVTIVPLKVEYGARISDEFLYASEEAQIEVMKNFNAGFAKKVARGLDIMAFHGVNPRSRSASSLIGTNHFDNGVAVITAGSTPDAQVENAVAKVQDENGYDVTGMAMAPVFRGSLAALTLQSGERMFPDLAWGNAPGSIHGLPVDVNNTVSFNSSDDLAIVGDFESAFKWGYAKQIMTKIIQYGDPDNSGNDLQGHNQIYIRAEMYLGWGILDKNAFAIIQNP